MSFISTLCIVALIIIFYYVGMIGYDLYVDNQKKQQAEENTEVSIDVTDQLDSFQSYMISKEDKDGNVHKKFNSVLCQGMTPEKWNRLMNDAAEGSPNAELNNILHNYTISDATSADDTTGLDETISAIE